MEVWLHETISLIFDRWVRRFTGLSKLHQNYIFRIETDLRFHCFFLHLVKTTLSFCSIFNGVQYLVMSFVASLYNAGIKNLHIRIKETDLSVTPADEVPILNRLFAFKRNCNITFMPTFIGIHTSWFNPLWYIDPDVYPFFFFQRKK